MEFKTDALLLRGVDYGENDKMVTLLTADRGKIGAAVKGVKKAGARLKFAAQPFCFAEYVLAEKNGRHTVTSASLHDGFFALREDVGAFYAATAVCEVCDKIMYEGIINGELLVFAVTALKEMCEGEVSFALVKFLLSALRLAGYPVRAEDCPNCGQKLTGRLHFDMESGAFFCGDCPRGTPASEVTYLTIRAALGTPSCLPPIGLPQKDEIFLWDKIAGEGAPQGRKGGDGEKRALRLLSAYFHYQTDTELNSLNEYIRLI